MTVCINPHCPLAPARRSRRCHACRMYRWRHGRERPAYLARGEWRACGVLDCGQRVHARGLCLAHYNRWRAQPTRRAPRPCSNPVCPALAHPAHGARCGACAVYWWRHHAERPRERVEHLVPLCGAADCERRARTRGRCARHYMAAWRAERAAQRAAAG